MTGPAKVRTLGLSNKLIPAVVALLAGFLLMVLGEHQVGLGVVLAALGTLGFGYGMPADRQTRD